MDSAMNPSNYGPVAAELLSEVRVPALGPGRPNAAARAQLEAADVDRLFAHAQLRDRGMAEACRSGLWLYHDYLEESHVISQSIESATGSYWHGIMHRREPDFGNSAYWLRRVGRHTVFVPLAKAAAELARSNGGLSASAWMAEGADWDPFRFIDTCKEVYRKAGPDHELCRQVALAEWRLLFDDSYRGAVGG